MSVRRLLVAVALLALVAGCSSAATDDTCPSGGVSLAEQQESNGAVVPGYSLSVAKLGIDRALLVALGLNPDKSIQVPPLDRPQELGVYAKGPMPGEVGPAVILGHVNARGQDGAFRHLDALQVGDEVTTSGPNGATRFVVYRTQTVPKAEFPTSAVYEDRTVPEIVLITCGGALNTTEHSYDSNVIVYGRKV